MTTEPIKRLFGIIAFGFSDLGMLSTSFNVGLHYFYAQIFLKRKNRFKYENKVNKFIKTYGDLNFNHGDFFSNNISSWLHIFEKYYLFNKKLAVLEVGSYEGRSSYFLLKFLKKIQLTCVDTFKPFHELQDNNHKKFNQIFDNFKRNTSKYLKQLKIFRGTSHDFFKKNKYEKFDLIYIDGSHEYNYVAHDANKAFLVLKKNGILIFDDFMWENYAQKKLPFHAIMKFLKKNNHKLNILYVDYQLIIKKIKN